MVVLLLKPKFLGMRNTLSKKVVLRRLPFIFIGLLFWILFYVGTLEILSYIREIEIFGEILSKKLFSMIFFSLTGFLILSNIITALSSFYLSKDLHFLLSQPLELRNILRLKSCDTVATSSWMVLSFIPPVLLAYGISYKASPGFYVMISAAFFFLTLITAGIGISVAHMLTRLFPAQRTRKVLLGLSLTLLIIFYFMIRSVTPLDFSTPEHVINTMLTFKTDSPFLPSYWTTESVWPLITQQNADPFYLYILLTNSAFFLLVSEFMGLRLFRGNIERIQPSAKGYGSGIFRGFFPGRSASIIYKDAKIFFRDTGQWSQLFIIGALVMIYIYNFRSIPVDALSGLTPHIKEIMVLVNMALAGLVLSAVAARFLYASVSLEGRSFWIIRTAPLDIRKFLWHKLLLGCIPITCIMSLLVFLTNMTLQVHGTIMLISVGTTLLLCIAISGLATGFGAVYPKFEYDTIASVSMSLAGMAFMLIAFSIVLVTLSLEAWIFYLYTIRAGSEGALGLSGRVQILLALLMILFINITAFLLPMKIGEKRISEYPCSL